MMLDIIFGDVGYQSHQQLKGLGAKRVISILVKLSKLTFKTSA